MSRLLGFPLVCFSPRLSPRLRPLVLVQGSRGRCAWWQRNWQTKQRELLRITIMIHQAARHIQASSRGPTWHLPRDCQLCCSYPSPAQTSHRADLCPIKTSVCGVWYNERLDGRVDASLMHGSRTFRKSWSQSPAGARLEERHPESTLLNQFLTPSRISEKSHVLGLRWSNKQGG